MPAGLHPRLFVSISSYKRLSSAWIVSLGRSSVEKQLDEMIDHYLHSTLGLPIGSIPFPPSHEAIANDCSAGSAGLLLLGGRDNCQIPNCIYHESMAQSASILVPWMRPFPSKEGYDRMFIPRSRTGIGEKPYQSDLRYHLQRKEETTLGWFLKTKFRDCLGYERAAYRRRPGDVCDASAIQSGAGVGRGLSAAVSKCLASVTRHIGRHGALWHGAALVSRPWHVCFYHFTTLIMGVEVLVALHLHLARHYAASCCDPAPSDQAHQPPRADSKRHKQ
ncbi:hypothetical protein K456DRAFT_1914620 [Colletotrichum gloeosporioides 23]|nr:hypothetical protein K456DRAFT_1914620 [Colletotrichum gloeosporioides 23]